MEVYVTRSNPDELMHYGVKGMKWGHRRAQKYAEKVRIARESADEWDQLANTVRARGKVKRANRFEQNAKEDRAAADKIQAKLDKKVEKKYAKAGVNKGKADYWNEKGEKAYESHNRNAKVLDKTAKKLESEGKYLMAEAARKSAEALRVRGENVRAEHRATGESYLKRSNKLTQKASSFATAANTDLGKSKIDSILKSSSSKGYTKAKTGDEYQRELELEEKLGSDGYNAYNKVRGKR